MKSHVWLLMCCTGIFPAREGKQNRYIRMTCECVCVWRCLYQKACLTCFYEINETWYDRLREHPCHSWYLYGWNRLACHLSAPNGCLSTRRFICDSWHLHPQLKSIKINRFRWLFFLLHSLFGPEFYMLIIIC